MKLSKELKIGIFTVTIAVAGFFVINFLRGEDIMNREMDYVSYYPDLEGLVVSAPVYVKGYKAGSVSSVEYDADMDMFRVECSVLKDFRVPSDSRLVIYGVDIMGGKGIRIDYGSSLETAEDGAVLEGEYEPDLISSLSSGIVPLLEKLNGLTDSLGIAVSGINSLFSETNRASVSGTLVHLERTAANAESISAAINGKSAELDAFVDNLHLLSSRFVEIAGKADSAMTDINAFSSSLAEADIRNFIESLNGLVDSLRDPDGSIGKLMSSDAIYNDIDSLLSDIDKLIKEIEKNPKKYIRISVF